MSGSQTEKLNLSPALKKETCNVARYTGFGTMVMWIVFALLHAAMPEKVPFDLTVLFGGLGGSAVAVLNFFLMGLTIQRVTSTEDQKLATAYMRASYSRRMLMQGLWAVLAIVLPCFQFAAGLLPLLFPGAGIKLAGIFSAARVRLFEKK